VPKLGNLLLLLNLYNLFNNPISNPSIDYGFTQLGSEFIMITGVLSMLVGSISLLSQVKVKRFFAYSSICHVGFLL
jgi:NADH:ubiquinone oxidoreductase subunit 2 (subunit N)